MKKGTITWSTGFQIFLYFVLAASVLVGSFCSVAALWLWDNGVYSQSYQEYRKDRLDMLVSRHYGRIWWYEASSPKLSDIIEGCRNASQYDNVTFRITRTRDDELIWSNVDRDAVNTEEIVNYFSRGNYYDSTAKTLLEEEYCIVTYVDLTFPKADEIKEELTAEMEFYFWKEPILGGAIGGILLALISFIWLLCNAGHRKGKEGITPGVLTNIYLDVLTVFFGIGAYGMGVVFLLLWWSLNRGYREPLIFVGIMAETVWCTIYLREFALRMKLGKWWRHSLIYVVCRFVFRGIRKLWQMQIRLLKGLPTIPLVVGVVIILSFCEFLGISYGISHGMSYGGRYWSRMIIMILWALEKMIVIPIVLYCALAFTRLLNGSRAMAEGDLSRKLDMRYLVYKFREHGENLNKINEGITKAVEQRMQSERLKTELITNVSHDLKTPLTSIINYADLLGNAAMVAGKDAGEADQTERIGQIQEYSEVLLRQSARLKKLLDDLVDASKANTGSIEVNPVPCELGVLLTQVAGEYEEKLAEKELALHVTKPEEEIRILADGRHLWRVFDNLMNNICKYAQEHSRVYLNMAQTGDKVEIIFRNMSKYELNVSPEELSERFVRGDASRHMEGSGLGLSIAKSLVELQKGEMEILTDGDLFKVILRFEVLKNAPEG